MWKPLHDRDEREMKRKRKGGKKRKKKNKMTDQLCPEPLNPGYTWLAYHASVNVRI